jgi:uncharacterized protein (TIGR02001 family)
VIKTILLFTFLFSVCGFAQTSGSSTSSTQPTFRMNGSAQLTSNYIEKGLTQTDGDPGLQADFWFNLGSQFRVGVWGANVSYDSASSTHFWLKANADVRVDFSQTSNLIIKYSNNQYFRSNNRDGNTIGVHLDFSGYKVLYEIDSNWQGTQDGATYAGLGKDFPIWNTWVWANQGGYTIPEADGVQSFFDYKTGLGKKFQDIFAIVSVSYSNASGSFKDQGELAGFLSVSVKY